MNNLIKLNENSKKITLKALYALKMLKNLDE